MSYRVRLRKIIIDNGIKYLFFTYILIVIENQLKMIFVYILL